MSTRVARHEILASEIQCIESERSWLNMISRLVLCNPSFEAVNATAAAPRIGSAAVVTCFVMAMSD